ncbi:MAG: hypothetical protein IPL32_20475 [Chloracidobacterium sp.]|nr:hypothetical protein [Chloracidobacterium sp.]
MGSTKLGTVGETRQGRTVNDQNQNVRTPRRDAAGHGDNEGTRYRTGGLWTMRATGVMVDGDRHRTRKGSPGRGSVDIKMEIADQGDVVGDGEHVCRSFWVKRRW